MKRVALLACWALMGLPTFAEEAASDPIMGIWEGSWSADGGVTGKLTARTAALGRNKYESEFTAEVEGNPQVFRMPFTAEKDGDKTKLSGEFTLPDELGGKYKFTGSIENDTLAGTSESDTQKTEVSLKKTKKTSPSLGAKPPAGAVVLFDGSDLSQWIGRDGKPAEWIVENGAMKVGKRLPDGKITRGGDIIAKPTFEDAKIHIEFMTPFMPTARGQARGNSGVYVQGLYEVQVLDSFGQPPRDNEAGGIYKTAVPKVNASLPPGEWQTYDITFHAPRRSDSGKVEKPAQISVVYNGTLIHDKVDIKEPTFGNAGNDPAKPGPILLQDHGNPVQFRNIWFVPIGKDD